jgi:hypothetical protein
MEALATLSPFSYSFRVTLCREDMKDSSNSSSRDDQTYNKRCSQSVSQEIITTKEERFERERELWCFAHFLAHVNLLLLALILLPNLLLLLRFHDLQLLDVEFLLLTTIIKVCIFQY